jgi:hypothetical protein
MSQLLFGLTTKPVNARTRKVFDTSQSTEIQEHKVFFRERLDLHKNRYHELSSSDPDYRSTLDMKECIFEAVDALLRQLASEENNLNGLTNTPGLPSGVFAKQRKETEDMLLELHYQQLKMSL